MPLNTLRLNHLPSSHPNSRIVFIKPLPRPPSDQDSYRLADTFLQAIAAQCLPVMTKHWLSVTTLEEHEPNKEFLGRNFNAGECIQLVLRSKGGDGWLRFEMVQMVMMHELAHNVEMNHGKNFWRKRDEFASDMRGLWTRGYTGEGFWGRGRVLSEMRSGMGADVVGSGQLVDLPLCGGTYRSRRKKRKRKVDGDRELTWKERRDRRIEKKFGKNGVSLGEDEDRRLCLEIGSKGPVGGKPRVAQSKRGRELRAAAALARFETSKKEVEDLEQIQEEHDLKAEEDSDGDEYDEVDADQGDALDLNGETLRDSKGEGMIKVCEEGEMDDVYVKSELQDLEDLDRYPIYEDRNGDETEADQPLPEATEQPIGKAHPESAARNTPNLTYPPLETPSNSLTSPSQPPPEPANPTTLTCPICSLDNDRLSVTCAACANVLDRRKDLNAWTCSSTESCRQMRTIYVNSGDVGVCGVCGVGRVATPGLKG